MRFYIAKGEQGFAVLTSTILLSLVAILVTTKMAYYQLIDNQITANYYRNLQAYSNAQSGFNFVLAKLSEPRLAVQVMKSLPQEYESADGDYRVSIVKLHTRKIAITAYGYSVDGSAVREIKSEVDLSFIYPIPNAAISTNGKINLASTASVNGGCEGVAKKDCLMSSNIAPQILITNPHIEEDEQSCTGDKLAENVIAEGVLQGEGEVQEIEVNEAQGELFFEWPYQERAQGSEVVGLNADISTKPSTLFEATFGFVMSEQNLAYLWGQSIQIDTTSGDNCSELLLQASDKKQIIYIKGDCDIDLYHAQQSANKENAVFTIGSAFEPKLIFIEGGAFTSTSNIEVKVVGMLYFLPGKQPFVDENNIAIGLDGKPITEGGEVLTVEDLSVNIAGVNVNGALLSEYRCSFNDAYSATRFDRLVLEDLYLALGMKATHSDYQIVAGTWKDF